MEEAEFRLTVNGAAHSVTCEPDTLLDVLRHDLGLAATFDQNARALLDIG